MPKKPSQDRTERAAGSNIVLRARTATVKGHRVVPLRVQVVCAARRTWRDHIAGWRPHHCLGAQGRASLPSGIPFCPATCLFDKLAAQISAHRLFLVCFVVPHFFLLSWSLSRHEAPRQPPLQHTVFYCFMGTVLVNANRRSVLPVSCVHAAAFLHRGSQWGIKGNRPVEMRHHAFRPRRGRARPPR